MIASEEAYQQIIKQKKYLIYLLAKTPQDVLLGNHPIEKNTYKRYYYDKRGSIK
jgi:hypothetical protein